MILVGSLVTLKPLHKKYFEEYHKAFSPIVRNLLHLSPTATLQETIVFLSEALCDANHKLFFCVFDKMSDNLIGGIVFRSSEHMNGQLGAWLNENYWGGGRYVEALTLALNEFFKTEDTVSAYVNVDNIRSLKAHKKVGFTISCDVRCCEGRDSYKIVLSKKRFFKTCGKTVKEN